MRVRVPNYRGEYSNLHAWEQYYEQSIPAIPLPEINADKVMCSKSVRHVSTQVSWADLAPIEDIATFDRYLSCEQRKSLLHR